MAGRWCLSPLVRCVAALLALLALAVCCAAVPPESWAVVASTSRFFHNYRHTTNALLVYDMLRGSGVPDSRIILMLADDSVCDPRNTERGQAFADDEGALQMACADAEVDYRGDAVTANSFLRAIAGVGYPGAGLGGDGAGHRGAGLQGPVATPSSPNATLLVYFTGHSAEQFMKFHDYEYLSAHDIAEALRAATGVGGGGAGSGELSPEGPVPRFAFDRVWMIADTCQAESMFDVAIDPRAGLVDRVAMAASSVRGEDSLSRLSVRTGLAAALTDALPYEMHRVFRSDSEPGPRSSIPSVAVAAAGGDMDEFADGDEAEPVPPSQMPEGQRRHRPLVGLTLQRFMDKFSFETLRSHPWFHQSGRPPVSQWLVSDFFVPA